MPDTTTDRELLMRAAKSAEKHYGTWCEPGELLEGKGGFVQFVGFGRAVVWNPLTDWHDAMELAVKLRMALSFAYCTCCAVVDWADNEDENEDENEVMVRFGEDFPDREATDASSAMKRAIVRAAATLAGADGGSE